MRVTIAAVGRMKNGPQRLLFDEYTGRLGWPLTLREIDIRKRLSPAELTRAEGEALLEAVPAGARIVVMDERGRSLPSSDFARTLGRWQEEGAGEVAFLIGGADGHSDAVRSRASLLLSFGAATWPHMLARVMLAEQIYRAQQILAGHPYHREG
ncbi:23S rRNA (pseudouridine(1915)-N(3))-methyltransferase RlmH [Radicibacter daui]|uniref:23S rRNA (pseudouridine(1915)-N(3))-methyltransferase RlmH n=1 Tax=Radicibacter daui TaxID=3064829 RepID=UPI004046C4DA